MYRAFKILISIIFLLAIFLIMFPVQFSRFTDLFISAAESPAPGIIRIVGFLLGTLSALIGFVALKKEVQAKKILNAAADSDKIWDAKNMKYLARAVFYKIQEALEKKDSSVVNEFCTPEFRLVLESHLKAKELNGIIIINSALNILETRIIGCEDQRDDNADRFVAYLGGKLRNTIVNPENLNIRDGKSLRFSEAYYFVRNRNQWLLEQIESNVSIWDLLTVKSILEV
jgi:predicted lipid-binding transport protein (Tim44 family)